MGLDGGFPQDDEVFDPFLAYTRTPFFENKRKGRRNVSVAELRCMSLLLGGFVHGDFNVFVFGTELSKTLLALNTRLPFCTGPIKLKP